MEAAVSFGAKGERLYGILHSPDQKTGRPDVGIVFTHSGSRGRLGNSFHFTFWARQFANAGYPVLRFDPAGLGDSTGSLGSGHIDDYYGKIQTGLFVPDTLAAIEEMKRLANPREIVLLGVCGGAATALLSSQQAEGVSGVVLMSVPVLLDYSDQDHLSRVPPEYARAQLVQTYKHKLFSPLAWLRLLTLKSEMRTIGKFLMSALRRESSGSEKGETGIRVNKMVADALHSTVRGNKRILFFFGEHDSFRREFERDFMARYWDREPLFKENCRVHEICGCNHMFTMVEWQREIGEITLDWLRESSPVNN